MAFCNSCGAGLDPGTRFCSKCGAAILASSPAPGSSTPAPAVAAPAASSMQAGAMPPATTGQGGGALKAILIVAGVIVLIGFLAIVSAGFFAWHVARHAHVRQNGNDVTVETPFGSVQTTKDPEEAARNLGVDLYPGAEVSKQGAASATFGGVRTASLSAESSDSVDKVSSFYKSRFPNAMVTASDADRCTIVSDDHKNMITIVIKANGDKTKIQITNVTRESDENSSSK